MGLVNQLTLTPNTQIVQLMDPLVFLMLAFHLFFLGVTTVSIGLSLMTRKPAPAVSQRFLELMAPGRFLWLVFSLLPLAMLTVLYGLYLHGTENPILPFLERIFVLTLLGYLAAAFHQRTGKRFLGALATLILLGSAFHFMATMTLISVPEQWQFRAQRFLPFTFSIQVVVHFAQYLLFSLLLTGVSILVRYFGWPEGRLDPTQPGTSGIKTWGLALTLAPALLHPVVFLWDFGTAHHFAVSWKVFIVGMVAVAFLLPVAIMSLSMLLSNHLRFIIPAAMCSLLVFGLFLNLEQRFQNTANAEQRTVMARTVDSENTAWTNAREAEYAKSAKPDPALGKKIFAERCSACHKFDTKLVGPPYNDVIPKYVDKPDDLMEFIRKPRKINPDYPPMPNQGLTELEVQSVATYLISQVQDNGKEGGQ